MSYFYIGIERKVFLKKSKCVTCVKDWPINLIALSQSVNSMPFVHANGCSVTCSASELTPSALLLL